MIISKTPCRLSFAGGGSDIASYYREHGGAGLGLAIVKAICTAHSGRVEVESTEGRGSCFRVTLPLPGQPKT